MIPLLGGAQMRALDAEAQAWGLPAFTMMETAGRGVAERVMAASPRPAAVAVVCGPGGNGGDGFVAARALRDRGVAALVYLVAPPAEDSPAGQHRRLYERCGGPVIELRTAAQLAAQRAALAAAPLVLDALLGVGLARPVTGHLAEVIAAMAAAPRCWAIDIPSGLDADRGVPLGACVRAEVTVSLGAHKLGVVTSPGFHYAGALHLVDLGMPAALLSAEPALRLLEDDDARRLLPASSPLDHKGSRGHALVVAGRAGMRGAGELASTAAMRIGAGLCTWAAPGDDAPTAALPSLMTQRFRDAAELSELFAGKAAICVGPGLGRDAAAGAAVEAVVEAALIGAGSAPPLVLDADALVALAARATPALPARTVLTPHPGEAGHLLGVRAADVEADRRGAALELARRHGCVVVLKGARPVVADPAHAWICTSGSAALATAGSGDVLAGAIAGLCAQGVAPMHAALLATWLHGRAGRELARSLGERGVLSADLPLQLALELAAQRARPAS